MIQYRPKDWKQNYEPGDDKVEHSIVGVILGFFTYLSVEKIGTTIGLSRCGAAVFAICSSVFIVLVTMWGKEVWDSLGNGCADIWDMTCGVVGFVLVILPVLIIFSYIKAKGESK